MEDIYIFCRVSLRYFVESDMFFLKYFGLTYIYERLRDQAIINSIFYKVFNFDIREYN